MTGVRVVAVPQLSYDDGATWVDIGVPIPGVLSTSLTGRHRGLVDAVFAFTPDSGGSTAVEIPVRGCRSAASARFEYRRLEDQEVLYQAYVFVDPILPGDMIELRPAE